MNRRRFWHRTWRVIALALLAVSAIPPRALALTPFLREYVEPSGPVGSQSSLALDINGVPNIAYFSQSTLHLKYAHKVSGYWTIETVDAAGDVGRYPCLALDAAGNPRITYWDGTNGDLKYASKSGGTWATETVDGAAAEVGRSSSLRLDHSGNPCVSYYDGTHGNLKYAKKTGGVWSIETVNAVNDGSLYNSLALDYSGNPSIAYATTSGHLNYASKSGGSWTFQTADGAAGVGSGCSLALDSSLNPHISYYDSPNGDLKYASRSGSTWSREVVDGLYIDTGQFSSLQLGNDDAPHITYYDPGDRWLWMAVKTGSTWQTENVDFSGNSVGMNNSLALDGQNNPCVSYFDATTSRLEYADSGIHVWEPGNGEVYSVYSSMPVRWGGSGEVTVEYSQDLGRSWVYFATLNGALPYNQTLLQPPYYFSAHSRIRMTRASPYDQSASPANFTLLPGGSRTWQVTTLDATGTTGQSPSIALRGALPTIGYYDFTNGDLRVATSSGGPFSFETPDAIGNVGSYASLKLFQGNPSVAYRSQPTGALKLAVKSSGSWSIETVTSANGYWCSLALDSQGQPRIAYYDIPSSSVKLAEKNGGSWTFSPIENVGLGSYISLALDSQGNPRIAYFNWTQYKLKYAARNGGSWTIETPDPGHGGKWCSLALDAANNPQISYVDDYFVSSKVLRIASKSAGVWSTGPVHGAGSDDLWYTSLAINSQGQSAVTFSANGLLLYYGPPSGGGASEYTAPDILDVQATSLALTPLGNPRIAYYDAVNGDLKYANSGPDEVPPAAVADLSALGGCTVNHVTWTASGDDSTTGQANHFELRRSLTPITDANFTSAPVAASGTPDPPGTLTDFPDPLGACSQRYYYALKTWDELGNVSMLSNLPPRAGTVCLRPPLQCDDTRSRPAVEDAPAELLMSTTFPNPARDRVSFQLGIPARLGSLTYQLGVFDLSGRQVRLIESGRAAPGLRTLTWDLHSESGQQVGQGVYFMRLLINGQAIARTIVVQR